MICFTLAKTEIMYLKKCGAMAIEEIEILGAILKIPAHLSQILAKWAELAVLFSW